jgi:hypothetical protein
MPSDYVLLILDVGTASPTELRSALVAANNLPGFLMRSGDRNRLIAQDELDGRRPLAELGVPVAVEGTPIGDARFVAFDIRAMDGGFLAPGVRVLGEARVKPGGVRLGMVVGGVVVYSCPIGPHDVLAHRVGRDRKCPQHPSQTVDP